MGAPLFTTRILTGFTVHPAKHAVAWRLCTAGKMFTRQSSRVEAQLSEPASREGYICYSRHHIRFLCSGVERL